MYADFSSMASEAAREATRDLCPLNGARKRTKFTPENVRQIINLVERGKSKGEIADIIGVTTGTLQVTCSKLGISLRRPRFDIGTAMLPRRRRAGKDTVLSAGANSQATPRTPSGTTREPATLEAPLMQDTE